MSSHAEGYRAAFATLIRPLESDDGVAEDILSEAERRLGVRLPQALRAFYLTAGRFDRFNRAQDRLMPPEDWSTDGGKLIFLEENQAVVFWAVEASATPDDDPPVFRAANTPDVPFEWEVEHDRCSEFLTVHLHWQAVCGGFEHTGMAEISHEAAEGLLIGWPRIGRVGELTAYGREGRAACVVGGDDPSQVYVGGRTQEEFEAIEAEFEAAGVGLDCL